jgi:hypothetical protein
LQITPLSRWLIYLVPPTLFVLNVFWFVKILKGALKLLRGAPRADKGRPRGEGAAVPPAPHSAVKKES